MPMELNSGSVKLLDSCNYPVKFFDVWGRRSTPFDERSAYNSHIIRSRAREAFWKDIE